MVSFEITLALRLVFPYHKLLVNNAVVAVVQVHGRAMKCHEWTPSCVRVLSRRSQGDKVRIHVKERVVLMATALTRASRNLGGNRVLVH